MAGPVVLRRRRGGERSEPQQPSAGAAEGRALEVVEKVLTANVV